jgi:hypothetical protein
MSPHRIEQVGCFARTHPFHRQHELGLAAANKMLCSAPKIRL